MSGAGPGWLNGRAVPAGGDADDVLTADGSGGFSWQAPAASGIGGSTGATDNALLRANGTGGATLQESLVTIGDDGGLTLPDVLLLLGSLNLRGHLTGTWATGDTVTVWPALADGRWGVALLVSARRTAGGSVTDRLALLFAGITAASGTLTIEYQRDWGAGYAPTLTFVDSLGSVGLTFTSSGSSGTYQVLARWCAPLSADP